jgi:hypothetical protein
MMGGFVIQGAVQAQSYTVATSENFHVGREVSPSHLIR